MTHQIVVSPTGVRWELARLPRAGAVGDQDARLMEALAVLRRVQNDMLAEDVEPQE